MLSQYQGIFASQKYILIFMILVYALYDVMIAKKKVEKYCDMKSENTKVLINFISSIEDDNFIGAKNILICDLEYMNEDMKNNLSEILDKLYSNYLVSKGIKKSKNEIIVSSSSSSSSSS